MRKLQIGYLLEMVVARDQRQIVLPGNGGSA
jgi:hypothetical protein